MGLTVEETGSVTAELVHAGRAVCERHLAAAYPAAAREPPFAPIRGLWVT